MLLSFDKPKKARPTSEHNEAHQSDTRIAGTYVPNISEEDKLRWKAKHIRGKDPRVEIRKTVIGRLITTGPDKITNYEGYAQVLLTVRKPISAFNDEPFVEMSANGRMIWSMTTWHELTQVVNEAWNILKEAKESQ